MFFSLAKSFHLHNFAAVRSRAPRGGFGKTKKALSNIPWKERSKAFFIRLFLGRPVLQTIYAVNTTPAVFGNSLIIISAFVRIVNSFMHLS